LHEFAIEPAAYRHGVDGGDGTERLQRDLDVAPFDLDHAHGRHLVAHAEPPAAPPGSRGRLADAVVPHQARAGHQQQAAKDPLTHAGTPYGNIERSIHGMRSSLPGVRPTPYWTLTRHPKWLNPE